MIAEGDFTDLESPPDGGDDAQIELCALKLLAAREHSSEELARKLRLRNFDPTAIARVLGRLVAEHAVDESRLAEHYVAERARKGFGPLRIRAELREKGLQDGLIDIHLKTIGDDWPTYLADAYQRKFGDSPLNDRAIYAKRARFLQQRGFPTDMIRRFLRWND